MSALLDEAGRRYFLDPGLNGKVTRVLRELDDDLAAGTGQHLSAEDRSLAALAAAAAIVSVEARAT